MYHFLYGKFSAESTKRENLLAYNIFQQRNHSEQFGWSTTQNRLNQSMPDETLYHAGSDVRSSLIKLANAALSSEQDLNLT
ncbi:hypothetical protein AB6E26_25655 [Vibrio splendidus]